VITQIIDSIHIKINRKNYYFCIGQDVKLTTGQSVCIAGFRTKQTSQSISLLSLIVYRKGISNTKFEVKIKDIDLTDKSLQKKRMAVCGIESTSVANDDDALVLLDSYPILVDKKEGERIKNLVQNMKAGDSIH